MARRSPVLQQQWSGHLLVGNYLDEKQYSVAFKHAKSENVLILSSTSRLTHLTEGTFQLPQEIMITQIIGITVDVVHAKPQPLHHLKVVVDDKLPGKLWVKAVQDHLCAAKLLSERMTKETRVGKCG